jgi:protein-disulfide isomerase
MEKYYLLTIPIFIGLISGIFLASYPESESDSSLLTIPKLIDGGSPIMGKSNAPITILEWGDYQCTFCYKFHQNTLDIINDDYIKTGR